MTYDGIRKIRFPNSTVCTPDDAVLTRLFELTVEDVRERNRARTQDEILETIEEALAG